MDEILTVNVRDMEPAQLGGEIRLLTMQARRMMLSYGIQIGYRLHIAHEKVGPHGWAEWLKKETDFSAAAASRFETLYEGYGEEQGNLFGVKNKFPTLENLSISNALRLLAVPESEREDFAAEVGAETLSVRELEARVRERTAALEAERDKILRCAQDDREKLEAEKEDLEKLHAVQLHDAETALDEEKTAREEAERARLEAEETILRMKKEIQEIEARPRDVAYERDERAIQEAVEAERTRQEKERAEAVARAANEAADAERAKHAAGEKEAKKKLAAFEKEMQDAATARIKLEKELKEAQAKAAAAEKAGADAAALSEQVETLKKQLALAAPEVAEFKAAFDRAQDELVHMNKALHEIRDEEIREKLRKACSAMLAGFQERVAG